MLSVFKLLSICTVLVQIQEANVQACGGTLPDLTGDFTHENYPENYNPDMNCQWDTIAREPDKVFFNFELLDIEADNNGGCSYDSVSIKFPDDSEAEKFCGRKERRDPAEKMDTNGTGNPIIKFVSDDSVQYTGFSAKYRIERYDYCQSEPCENGGTCVLDEDNTEYGWTCECVSGWTGQTCSEDLDECEAEPCENDGQCTTPEFDMYECDCLEGFTGENCEINIDECESDPCQHGGECVDEVNSYKCECSGGFTGERCGEEIDECESDPCQNGGTCEDKMDGYNCICIRGYRGDNCEIDIDDCENEPCQNDGTCNDEIDGYTCVCQDGFTGTNCEEEVNECSSNPCQNGGTCINKLNSYECECAQGFTSQHCEIELDECDSNPCQNMGHCVDHPSMYECICEPGFAGVNCDEDACDPSPCLNGGTCEYGEGGYNCICTPEFDGRHCDGDEPEPTTPTPEKNKPEENNKNNDNDKPNGNDVLPDQPNDKNPLGEKDNLDNEANVCASRPCLNDGECLVDGEGYSCLCKSGYNGVNCETLITKCKPDPCLNEGLCRENGDSYKCECKHGYVGTHCETDEAGAMHERAHLLSALLPCILFCIVLLTLALLFFLYIRKKRKNKTHVEVIKVKPSTNQTQFVSKSKKDGHRFPMKKRSKKRNDSHNEVKSDSVTEVENDYVQPFNKRPSAYVGNMNIPGVPMFYNESCLQQPHVFHDNHYYQSNMQVPPQVQYSYNNQAYEPSSYSYNQTEYDSTLWNTESPRKHPKQSNHLKYRGNIDRSDLSSYSNKYDTSTEESNLHRSHDDYQRNNQDNHWQDRDNKKLNNCPTKHMFYVPEGPARLESKLEHKRTSDRQSTMYTHKQSYDNGEKIPRFQREKTHAFPTDKKSHGRKISFDPRVSALSPINEQQVRSERYSPEGGIDQKIHPEAKQKHLNDNTDIQKVSPFKCIRKNNPLNINRGRGFNRENAFVQKI